MKKFLNQVFSEESKSGEGKFSAKRSMGIITGLLAAGGSIVSGLDFYNVPESIINPMWIYSGAMLGVSILKGVSK